MYIYTQISTLSQESVKHPDGFFLCIKLTYSQFHIYSDRFGVILSLSGGAPCLGTVLYPGQYVNYSDIFLVVSATFLVHGVHRHLISQYCHRASINQQTQTALLNEREPQV